MNKRNGLSLTKDKGHVTTRTASSKSNKKAPTVEKMASTRQTSQSLSSRKASSLSTRAVAALRSQSTSPTKSRAMLKRLHITSPQGKTSPKEKRRKVESENERGRTRSLGKAQAFSPAKKERKRLLEMKKLMTTEGFWAASSPAIEKDNLQVQRRASSFMRSSRTSTPEGQAGKKPINVVSRLTPQVKNVKPEKEQPDRVEKELPGSSSTSELRRLQTTEGFWSPSNILSDSRDASPASTSSLERSFRHRSQQKKNSTEALAASGSSQEDGATTKIKQNDIRIMPSRPSSAPENLISGLADDKGNKRTSRAKFTSNSLKKKSLVQKSLTRCGKGNGKLVTRKNSLQDVDSNTDVLLTLPQQQSEDVKRSLRKRKGEDEDDKKSDNNKTSHDRQKRQSVTPKVKAYELVMSKILQSNSKDEVVEINKRSGSTRSSPASSLERKSKKSELQEKSVRRTRGKTACAESSEQENGMESDDKASESVFGAANFKDLSALSPEQNASSKLAISDLFGSGELRRLNTTPGFWAPTPDVSHVLGLSHSRRLSVSRKKLSSHSSVAKSQHSPKKSESSLLQLRKKKLSVLQKQRQLKQQTSKEEQQQKDPADTSNMDMEKPKSKKFIFGRKKKKYYLKKKKPPLMSSLTADQNAVEVCLEESAGSVKAGAAHDSSITTSKVESSLSSKHETKASTDSPNSPNNILCLTSYQDQSTLTELQCAEGKAERHTLSTEAKENAKVASYISTELHPVNVLTKADEAKPPQDLPVKELKGYKVDIVTDVQSDKNNRETSVPKNECSLANTAKHKSVLQESGEEMELETASSGNLANKLSPTPNNDNTKCNAKAARREVSITSDGKDGQVIKPCPTLKLEKESEPSQNQKKTIVLESVKADLDTFKQKAKAQHSEKSLEVIKIQAAAVEPNDKDLKTAPVPSVMQHQVSDSPPPEENNNANAPTEVAGSVIVKEDTVLCPERFESDLESILSEIEPPAEFKIPTAEVKSVNAVKVIVVDSKPESLEKKGMEKKPCEFSEEISVQANIGKKKGEVEVKKHNSMEEENLLTKPDDFMTSNQLEISDCCVNKDKFDSNPVDILDEERTEPGAKLQNDTSTQTFSESVKSSDQPMMTSDQSKSLKIKSNEPWVSTTNSTFEQPFSEPLNKTFEDAKAVPDKIIESTELVDNNSPTTKFASFSPQEPPKELKSLQINSTENGSCSGEPTNMCVALDLIDASSEISQPSLQMTVTTPAKNNETFVSKESQAQKEASNGTKTSKEIQCKDIVTTKPQQSCPNTDINKQVSKTAENNILSITGGLGKSETKQNPLRRVYKKKRNAWKKGILQKATKMYQKRGPIAEKIPLLTAPDQVVQAESVHDDGEITPLADQSLVTDSQNLTNTIRNAKKSAKEHRKSLLLRRLQTNANLAGGSIDDSQLLSSGRSLRENAPKNKIIPVLRKKISSDVNVIDSSAKFKTQGKRPPGRPRKFKRQPGVPKLVLSTQPVKGKNFPRRWYKSPPKLSPQPVDTDQTAIRSSNDKPLGSEDTEFVRETVDESDIHLYLSGVSDEEPSPEKSTEASDLRDMFQPLSLGHTQAAAETGETTDNQKTTKQSQTIVKNKVKGKKGRPPGTPMTEEEKNKVRSSLLARFDDYANFKMPRTAGKSTFTPSLYLAPNVPQPSSKKFSLRKKTTRSPLEMLEMKRKQEEAIYDLEEEKRLAKRINRLEKRYSQASADDLFEDEDFEWEIKDCAVVLNDFVKKLHLENIDLPPVSDITFDEEEDQKSESVDDVDSDVDEDWCADLEDFQDQSDKEWAADDEQREKRPFIPRLKLKRVLKVGRVKKAKSHKSKKRPKFVCPQQDSQQPLKLVIKTETPTSDTTDKVARLGPTIDVTSMQKKGFEGSFVDFLQGKKTNEFMYQNNKRPQYRSSGFTGSPQKIVANTSHMIMNLGDVGSLKSNSPPKQKSPLMVSSAAASGLVCSASDMGAMQSSYINIQSTKTDGGEKRTNQICAKAQPKALVEEVLVASKSNEENTTVPANSKPSQGQGSLVSEICSSTGSQKEKKSNKPLQNSIGTNNNNNNIEELSPKVPEQTPVSAATKSSASHKASPDPVVKRPPTSALPEGWKVKVIQLPDKQCSGKRFKCKRCSFNTLSQLTMESHIYSHIPGVQFRCAYCESEFSSMAATASHIKNTHQLGEAKLHISRHVDEHNFYDLEDGPASDEQPHGSNDRAVGSPRGGPQVVVAGGDSLGQGGQSPPVFIKVLVSSGAAATAGNHGQGVFVCPSNSAPGLAAPTSNRRRYVCTHCGFSTNVHADAEHHVSDLHPASSIFACTLCKENTYYSESEIKQHASTVHPSRHRPFRRLPDFYDAEKLNSTTAGCEDCLGDVGGSVFPDGHATEDSIPVDHRQRAKDYLQLQEGLKEKRSAEADSTTAADYMECEEQVEEQEPTESVTTSEPHAEAEGSQIDNLESISTKTTVDQVDSQDDVLPSDISAISSSAICSSQLEGDALTAGVKSATIATEEKSTSGPTERVEDSTSDPGAVTKQITDVENNKDEISRLKIVQVVSLSSSSTHLKECEESTSSRDEYSSATNASLRETPGQLPTSAAPSPAPPMSSSASTTSSSTRPPGSQSAPGQVPATSQPGGGLPLSYKCSACRVHTPYLLMMVKHLKAKHPHMACFSCPYCKTSVPSQTGNANASQPESFVTQKQLRSHIKRLHPDKTGRNEIALSAKAKQFVEAMVLPAGPECTRVGNRLVLEEDLHTCTYCNLKMTSLACVYEHLNEIHADLFEFVCPICQSFKSKELEAISVHSLEAHHSEVETDKVHVSVPKNLFSVLKCISKGGKYIEKQLDGTVGSSNSKSTTPTPSNAAKEHVAGVTLESDVTAAQSTLENPIAPLDLTSASNSISRSDPAHSPAAANISVKSPASTHGPSGGEVSKPAHLNFSSSLFDTSSLSVPPTMAVSSITGSSGTLVPVAAASSFLSPSPVKSQQVMAATGKQGNKANKTSNAVAAKSLPVLNVPTIKPRPQPSSLSGARHRSGDTSELPRTSSQPAINTAARIPVISHTSSLASTSTSQHPKPITLNLPTSSSLDDLPDDEPNPDAFKIFNLQPTPPLVNSPASLSVLHSPSPSSLAGIPSPSPAVPTVFPPVSTQLNPGFIQGPIVGFPASMVISPALLPPHASFSQQQQALFHSAGPAHAMFASSLSSAGNTERLFNSSSATSFTPPQRPKSTSAMSANTQLLKEQQKRELFLLKQQHQQQKQGAVGRPLLPELQAKEKQKQLRIKQLQAVQQAHQQQLIHQQKMIQQAVLNQQQQVRMLAQQAQSQGHTFPPFSVPAKSWPPLQQQAQQETLPLNTKDLPCPVQLDQTHPFSLTSLSGSTSTSSLSSSPAGAGCSSSVRPSKGVHKRSSSLYQCPYCPTPVTLKALDVASHIHQKHPGSQVVFKKATP